VLSSELRSSRPSKVLRILAFPSEPKITKASDELFHQASEIVQQRLARQVRKRKPASAVDPLDELVGLLPARSQVNAGQRLIVHQVAVVRWQALEDFSKWTEAYLRKAGAVQPVPGRPVRRLVEEYFKDGFHWFALDTVDLTPEPCLTEAVQYRFATRSLYFPLRSARLDEGMTSIRLVLVSPRLVRIPDGRGARVRRNMNKRDNMIIKEV